MNAKVSYSGLVQDAPQAMMFCFVFNLFEGLQSYAEYFFFFKIV